MKTRWYPFFIGLLLLPALLAGCAGKTAGGSAAEAAPSAGESAEPQAADVLAAYDEAARLYDWFDLAPMPLDETDTVEEGGTVYCRVADDSLTGTAELRSRLERVFTPELSEAIFSKAPDQYRDFAGKLYAIPGGRGANLYLLDKTLQAERVSEDHWAVTLTFWADFEDSHTAPEPGTDFSVSYPVAVAGYSTTRIDYERTPEGWRFTSFCPTDNLDLDAETVYSFDYHEGFREDCSDWELVCYLIHADGAFAEGAFYWLYQRFLDRPNDILACLALLDGSPYAAVHPHIDSLIAHPGYQAAYEDEEERLAFEEVLENCVPANAAEQAVLDKMEAAYGSASRREAADLRFSLTVPHTAVFTLGPQEGAFPWGLALDAEPVPVSPAMDGAGPCYAVKLDAVTLNYTVLPDGGREILYRMSTGSPRVSTDSGVTVGDTLARVKELYPDGVSSDTGSSSGALYVWEPGEDAGGRRIAFLARDGVVTGVEMEGLLDDWLLE